MVEVVPHVSWRELTVVIVSMMTLRHFLVQPRVQESKNGAPVLRSVVQHQDNKAKVDQGDDTDDSPESLSWCEVVHGRWL